MKVTKSVAPAFEDFLFNWDYERYLLIGGYGSGKSYQIGFKIILKLLEEKRKALVIRVCCINVSVFYNVGHAVHVVRDWFVL